MNDSAQLLEWFRATFRKNFETIEHVQDWKVLESAAIYRKHTGDIDGAVEAMLKAIKVMRKDPLLVKETASNLNYLADLFLLKHAIESAEEAVRESIVLSESRFPGLLADNLWILAGIQGLKKKYREAVELARMAGHLYHQQNHSHGVAQAEELIARFGPHQEV
jgi:tetratricopeptide (TPR) repeat protein